MPHLLPLTRAQLESIILQQQTQIDHLTLSKLKFFETLVRISNWDLPPTGLFWDRKKTKPTSYETEFGSNGARDYIKKLAADTIAAADTVVFDQDRKNKFSLTTRQKIIDKLEALQLEVDAMGFKGTNEYDLHLREEIANWLLLELKIISNYIQQK